ncbi:MAG TPA: palindromic element RPE5 domain-containing protein [Rickettsia endosymbiont of Pyrocoelia pectoralis]|nr:palindromic element RPE5 domain-containing protein [Rickettsia endosymbiont of Pyrocoelia pectoralis]
MCTIVLEHLKVYKDDVANFQIQRVCSIFHYV